jgi:Ca2+-binding RTX toxin-like protein
MKRRSALAGSLAAFAAATLVGVLPTTAVGAVTCQGVEATQVGTNGPDVINGTSHRDVIVGLRGHDVIDGRGGDDLICGSGGVDVVSDGPGDDVVWGGPARDNFLPGPGDDQFNGGRYGATLQFAGQPDAVDVDLEEQTATGSYIGHDRFRHVLRVGGSDGDDTLSGSNASDIINGGAGADVIDGRADHDVLDGGGLTDAAAAPDGDDIVLGGAYSDRLRDRDGPGPLATDDVLSGGAGDDSFGLGYGANEINGGPGDEDTLSGQQASDGTLVVDLGEGTVSHAGSTATFSGVENVFGGAGDDVIRGDAAANFFTTGGGNDQIAGGAGDDRISLDVQRPGPETFDQVIDGGAGTDLLMSAYSLDADLAAGTAATPDVTATVNGIEDIWASWDADTLRGDDGPNLLIGSGGDDQLVGGGGNDRLYGGWPPEEGMDEDGVDSADGGPGHDVCVATTTVNCEE